MNQYKTNSPLLKSAFIILCENWDKAKTYSHQELLAIKREYEENERLNLHTENLKLLADKFGDEEEQMHVDRRLESMDVNYKNYNPDYRYTIPKYIENSINLHYNYIRNLKTDDKGVK